MLQDVRSVHWMAGHFQPTFLHGYLGPAFKNSLLIVSIKKENCIGAHNGLRILLTSNIFSSENIGERYEWKKTQTEGTDPGWLGHAWAGNFVFWPK